jgi:hypothetical protein
MSKRKKSTHPFRRGQAVMNHYHGIRRYGVIRKSRIAENGWRYVTINWIDDHLYERAMAWSTEMGQEDKTPQEYRIDQVEPFDPLNMIHKIALLTSERTKILGFNADVYQNEEVSNG